MTGTDRLFRPAHIPALGAFQDGGLKHNNPINLVLWECRHIWSDVEKPDVVVSLGTGTGEGSSAPSASAFRHVIRDGFIPRLWRSFVSSLDGQSAWRNLWNRLNNRAREDSFRFNILLSGDGPVMGDVERMQELRQCANVPSRHEELCKQTAFALLVASFFFELDDMPIFHNGQYHCKGTIRCRLRGQSICEALEQLCGKGLTFMTEKKVLGYLESSQDPCDECARYRKTVQFLVRHPSDPTSISMRCVKNGIRLIGGFPQTVNWFIQQQKSAIWFSRSTKIGAEPCETCSISQGWRQQKRKAIELCSATQRSLKRTRVSEDHAVDSGDHL